MPTTLPPSSAFGGTQRLQLGVRFAAPFQTSAVDDEDVDVLVADGLLAGGLGVVSLEVDRGVTGDSRAGERALEPLRARPGYTDGLGVVRGVEQPRKQDQGDHDEQHEQCADPETP
jgi:hypothetical protein